MTHENPLARSPHAILLVVLFQTLETRQHRWIFLGLVLLGTESVVAEGIEPDGLGLISVERLGADWGIAGLQTGLGNGRHDV